MNLDRFLELGECVIDENFMTWAEMVGAVRVDVRFEVRLVGEEGDDFSSNEDMYIVVVIRRELHIDAGNVCRSMLWFRGSSNLSGVGSGRLLLTILPRILPFSGPILQIPLLLMAFRLYMASELAIVALL